ncbi:chromogranin-A [Trichomycterus rosablanca]|uniref:chromogranin-A n=1 Tax=Trichomycterus rosablanca TaxID=2290929 RepID=UPI002F35C835
MRATGCALFLILTKCVFSIPLSPSNMDNEDVKVIKCIVDVLADTLTKPQSIPVSQECMETLRADDRLVSILRHRNFLEELQNIAGGGANKISEKGLEDDFGHTRDHAEDLESTADQSMLIDMLGPDEKAEKRGSEEEDSMEREEKSRKSKKNDAVFQEDRKEDQVAPVYIKQEHKDKHIAMKKADNKEEKNLHLEKAEEVEQRSMEESHEELKSLEDRSGVVNLEKKTSEMKMKSLNHIKQLTLRRVDGPPVYDKQGPLHHSKEVWKSPEEQELQMMAQKDPEDRREEEGSASKKTEDAEMESLAVIESELESMAQKLHELRHG